ncbi:hypothetical protein HDK90DRAFT_114838 [Phyllosticta capitalensis]|uniref:Secreted protein n=1 Tax=Phyllosticta capitalensis TaxID=121624 RepID=A0ABR1YA32_9PEZI
MDLKMDGFVVGFVVVMSVSLKPCSGTLLRLLCVASLPVCWLFVVGKKWTCWAMGVCEGKMTSMGEKRVEERAKGRCSCLEADKRTETHQRHMMMGGGAQLTRKSLKSWSMRISRPTGMSSGGARAAKSFSVCRPIPTPPTQLSIRLRVRMVSSRGGWLAFWRVEAVPCKVSSLLLHGPFSFVCSGRSMTSTNSRRERGARSEVSGETLEWWEKERKGKTRSSWLASASYTA